MRTARRNLITYGQHWWFYGTSNYAPVLPELENEGPNPVQRDTTNTNHLSGSVKSKTAQGKVHDRRNPH